MSLGVILTGTCTIQRPANTQDAIGGTVEAWSVKSANVPCLVRQLSAQERAGVGRELLVSTHRLYCEYDVDIRATDRVIYTGKTYDVQSVYNVDDLNRHLEVDMTRRV
jgi:SPP1 family predicted phage head-tail adaptor